VSKALTDLKTKIKLILSQVRPGTLFYSYRSTALQLLRDAIAAGHVADDPPRIEGPGEAKMVQEQVEALRALYVRAPSGLQTEFTSLLLANSSRVNGAVVVHAMIEIGGLRVLADALKNTQAVEAAKRAIMWHALREKIAHESHLFSEEDLNIIEKAANQETNRARSIIATRVRRLPPH